MRTRSFLLASVLAGVAAMVTASSVLAHARRESSAPEAGEVLATSPASVEIVFTQEVQKVSGTYGIAVADANGTDVTAADAVIDDVDRTLMLVALQPNLAAGRYVVTYRNVSDADGDEFEASYAFYVEVEPTEEDLAADRELAEAEGGKDTATPDATPSPNRTPEPGRTVTPADEALGEDEGGGSGTAITIVVALAAGAVGVGLGYVAYRMIRRNG